MMLSGCSSSLFETQSSEALRQSVIDTAQRELAPAREHPGTRQPRRQTTELTFDADRLAELEAMGGPKAYDQGAPALDLDMLGQQTQTVQVDLRHAITRAVQHNLNSQIARMNPAISEAALVAAQASFDWLFFTNFQWGRTDQPTRVPVVAGIPVGADSRSDRSVTYSTGIRKQLTTGGSFEISQGYTYNDNTSPGVSLFPDPSQSTFMQIDVSQPILRGFGSDVALAEIHLNENAERRTVHQFHATLIAIVTETERGYWRLVQAQRNLQILQKLLERGISTRDVLEARRQFDVKPAEYSDAVATVERRRADIIRADNELRRSSDALKALINDPQLTVGSEMQLIAADRAVDEPLEGSLLDVLTTAIRHRPEIQLAVLDIDDASIRQVVARNSRLPLLDVGFSARFQGLAADMDDSYEQISDARFVNMLLNVMFEQPIGNRAAQATYRSTQLQRMQATLGYRQTVQDVVLDVKTALRNIGTNYRLIEQTRVSRLAASENLRTLLVQEQTIQSLTPDFLDLKFRRQESLSNAELEEVRALIDYNIAIADLHRATGTALERSQIRLVVPDGGQFLQHIKPDISR